MRTAPESVPTNSAVAQPTITVVVKLARGPQPPRVHDFTPHPDIATAPREKRPRAETAERARLQPSALVGSSAGTVLTLEIGSFFPLGTTRGLTPQKLLRTPRRPVKAAGWTWANGRAALVTPVRGLPS